MPEFDTSATPSSAILRYGLALSSVAAALIVALLLRPDALVTPIFFLAIILAAWNGGFGPGLVAALLATVAVVYFFLHPGSSTRVVAGDIPHLLIFFVSAFLVSSWSVLRSRAEALLRQARDELEAKVQERTADLSRSNEQLQAEIVERNRAEGALQKSQSELAHVTRVTTLGELTASIAHEVNQPLAAVVTNGNACLRWLARQPPNLLEAEQAVERIIKDGHRASEVIGRIRTLVKKTPQRKDRVDINDIIHEVIALAQSEVSRHRVSLVTELSDGLPSVLGDRVQLQQVILNLIINGIEAMSRSKEKPRELVISAGKDDANGLLVAVRDSGSGLESANLEQLFDAFYTTKPDGMGMGLAISRSIIESHGGRLWATANSPHGAVFQFTLPAKDIKFS